MYAGRIHIQQTTKGRLHKAGWNTVVSPKNVAAFIFSLFECSSEASLTGISKQHACRNGNNHYPRKPCFRGKYVAATPDHRTAPPSHHIAPGQEVGRVGSFESSDFNSHQDCVGARTSERPGRWQHYVGASGRFQQANKHRSEAARLAKVETS